MLFIKFFLMALLGLAIYYGLSLSKFNSETPNLGFIDTAKLYFKQKIYALITNLLIIVALTLIIVVDSTGWFIKWLSGGILKYDVPGQFYIISLAIGFMGQSIFSLLMGAKNSIVVLPQEKDSKEG
jgi:hypothetical protein